MAFTGFPPEAIEFYRDHPRIDLIRRKGLMLSKNFGTPKWLHTQQVEQKVRECCYRLARKTFERSQRSVSRSPRKLDRM